MSDHDLVVQKIATDLEEGDWTVKADLPGWDEPDPIGQDNRVPDVEAFKNGWRQIYEVESRSSINNVGESEQQSAFRLHASQRDDTTFFLIEYWRDSGGVKFNQLEP